MRAVLQRVSRAKVTVGGRITGEIGPGLMILLGVGRTDTSAVVARMAERCANLRIFEDDQGKMNRSLLDVKGRSEEHTSELQSHSDLVCRLLLEKKKINR